ALLVERNGQEVVLKVASDPEQNARIRDEAEVLQKLRHQHIVEFCGQAEFGDRAGFLMRPVLVDKEDRKVETLGQRLRKEGRLHIDLLQRFGEDLLDVVNYLQEQGIHHRDIKPDNIAVGRVGRGDTLHVVLFDFSLSRTPVDNIRAGTSGYLDPLLALRKPPRWDLNAERYAAAVTLYELATGTMPKWGDGSTDPSHLSCEITIDPELFDPNLRDRLSEFFRKAFRRDPAERFDNAEEMLRAWRYCFEDIDQPGSLSDHEDEETLRRLLAHATFDTQIHELNLGTRATNALDRANLLTVEDLLTVPNAPATTPPRGGQQDAEGDRHGGPDPPRTTRLAVGGRGDDTLGRRRQEGRNGGSREPQRRPPGAAHPAPCEGGCRRQGRGGDPGSAWIEPGAVESLGHPVRCRRAFPGDAGAGQPGCRQVPGPLGEGACYHEAPRRSRCDPGELRRGDVRAGAGRCAPRGARVGRG
ncbi:MAG: protein kinase, partial [Isosphaeraceae bacterium]|nr:protein kinase [Isosphaeraceae bacterium]